MPTSHATAQLVGTASKCELVIERALVVGSPRLRVFLISWAKFSAWPAALQVVRRSPVGPGSHLPADRTTCAVTSHAPTDPTRPSSSASAARPAVTCTSGAGEDKLVELGVWPAYLRG